MDNARRDNAKENIAPDNGNRQNSNGDIYNTLGGPESGHECSICLNWLNNPLLTSCGHRFCSSCILSWLQQKNYCPIDSVVLKKDADLFPDNYTRREILQKRMVCPYSSRGCTAQLIPFDVDGHVKICEFRKTNEKSVTPVKSKIVCNFKEVGCDCVFTTQEQINYHMTSEMQKHLQLLGDAYSKLKLNESITASCANATGEEAVKLWDPTEKPKDGEHSKDQDAFQETSLAGLIRALYERIIILEQKNREQEIKLSNVNRLTNALSQNYKKTTEELSLRFCMGTYIWKIDNINQKLSLMLTDPSMMFYSPAFYTSPNGYRFCARLNASPLQTKYLALHLHLMKSENDNYLSWPFSGKISLNLINNRLPQNSIKDIMMANPTLGAFQKPILEFCPKGFGLTEYVSVDDLKHKGFILDDILTIVIKIQTV